MSINQAILPASFGEILRDNLSTSRDFFLTFALMVQFAKENLTTSR